MKLEALCCWNTDETSLIYGHNVINAPWLVNEWVQKHATTGQRGKARSRNRSPAVSLTWNTCQRCAAAPPGEPLEEPRPSQTTNLNPFACVTFTNTASVRSIRSNRSQFSRTRRRSEPCASAHHVHGQMAQISPNGKLEIPRRAARAIRHL